jgi:hypothetical protein
LGGDDAVERLLGSMRELAVGDGPVDGRRIAGLERKVASLT